MDETLAQVGEFGLIRRIKLLIENEGVTPPGVNLGVGDDAASFLPRQGYELLVTCDSMVEGHHFLTNRATPFDLGRRSMASNISDIGAMGGRPLYAVISLGLRGDTSAVFVLAMYKGFIAELNPFGAAIIGGNLTKSGDGLFIDITLIGEVEAGKRVQRSTARSGDVILVSGFPGESAASLHLWLRSQSRPELKGHALINAYNRPIHRAREGEAVGRTGFATAMIDISDGFIGDLGHICEASGKGAQLFLEKFPISENLKGAAQILGRQPYEFFMGESDDYELIITCSQDHVNQIRSAIVPSFSGPVTEVGRITEAHEGIRLLLPDGSEREIKGIGWDHFREALPVGD